VAAANLRTLDLERLPALLGDHAGRGTPRGGAVRQEALPRKGLRVPPARLLPCAD